MLRTGSQTPSIRLLRSSDKINVKLLCYIAVMFVTFNCHFVDLQAIEPKEKKKKSSSHASSPSDSKRKKSRSRSKSPSSKKRTRRSQSSESRSTSRSPARSRSRSPLAVSLTVLQLLSVYFGFYLTSLELLSSRPQTKYITGIM